MFESPSKVSFQMLSTQRDPFWASTRLYAEDCIARMMVDLYGFFFPAGRLLCDFDSHAVSQILC